MPARDNFQVVFQQRWYDASATSESVQLINGGSGPGQSFGKPRMTCASTSASAETTRPRLAYLETIDLEFRPPVPHTVIDNSASGIPTANAGEEAVNLGC